MKAIKKVCVEKLRITRESFFAFVVCMCVGLFTHAYMLLNKIPFYDDIAHLYDVASTVSCGRWFLGILGKCVDIVFGRNISIPFINGVLSLIFISISACVFVRCFRIKNLYNIGFIACLFSAFPVVTSIFGYMFTAPYYFLALCLSILSIYVVDKKYGVFWSVAFLALSLGIYQSFFCVAIIMSILMVMLQAKKECTEKELVIYTIRYLISLVGAIVIYFIMHKLSVMVTGIQMLNYQGVENMGELSLQSLISGTLLAYKQFLLMFMDDYRGVSSLPIIRIGMIFSAVFFVYLSIISLKTTKKV